MMTLLCLLLLVDSPDLRGVATTVTDPPPIAVRNGAFRIELGLQTSWVNNSALQPFSANETAFSSSIAVSRIAIARGHWALAPGIVWDAMSSGAAARGAAANLSRQRLGVTLEGRYAPLHWFYTYARLTPGAAWQQASVTDNALQVSSQSTAWGATLDATAGIACMLFPRSAASLVHFWISAEAGYGWTTPMRLLLTPQGGASETVTAGSTDLGRLSFQGEILRIAVATSF